MNKFEYYEFVAILIPGVILLYGLSLIFNEIKPFLGQDISIGEFGLFFILAFAFGHLLQAFGNALESVYWKIQAGMPTDWVRSEKHGLLGNLQKEQLEKKARDYFGMPGFSFSKTNSGDWASLVRRIYSAVEKGGQNRRADIFNCTYGLFRGLSVSFLLLAVSILFKALFCWPWSILCLVLFAISIYRMHRFGRNYARELFIQFLQLKD